MLSDSQKQAVEDLMRHVGEAVIRPYFRNLSSGDIAFKASEDDPVSIADKEAEKRLKAGLAEILPSSLFVGEETYAAQPNILDHLKQGDKPVWVVDPIDGTKNFVSGREGFGIMIALVNRGETIASWMYEVCQQRFTRFIKGQGVMVNGAPINAGAALPQPQNPYTGNIGRFIYQRPEVQAIKDSLPDIKLDPAKQPSIISYHKLLEGDHDFLIFKITHPWDHLPGIAMARAQGALAKRWSGEDFQSHDMDKGLIVARSQAVVDTVITQIITPLSLSDELMAMKTFKC